MKNEKNMKLNLLSLHRFKFKSTRNISPAPVPTAMHPSKAFKMPRLQTSSLMEQQLVIVSITSTR